ncbi:MAG: hypothetical protein H6710_16185 [Myxococcales bacterium]|nr:hypothetical protein [Myxococcales bacterium]MCB9706622.1 hypothetical protein [Myxococcales bacterium]
MDTPEDPAIDGGPYPARAGNLVIPWIDGIPFYERLLAAFRGARRRVWAIVSFIQPGFCFADGTSWWALLDECEARGVDVRVLFWRNPRFARTAHVFLGGPEERRLLAERGARWAGRWDSSGDDPAHCHHQKGFVIDAGEADAIAFIGGMVLSEATLAAPGHRAGYHKHDAFLELRGPAVADAEHNFVQRWNLARAEPAAPPWPDEARAGPLPYPTRVPAPAGEVVVQLGRTVQAGRYTGRTPLPGGESFVGGGGEATILAAYRRAFAAARRTIYIENQHPGEASLLALLDQALGRGVRVVMVVPGDPMPAIYAAHREVAALAREGRAGEHRYGPTFERLAALARHPGFTMIALARSDPKPGGGREHREIYTHAKLCVVDGAWATLGSANLVDLSLCADHTELNASFWGGEVCGALLRQLVAEHSDATAPADDRAALEGLAALARASRASLEAGGPVLGGCYALDPRSYALEPPLTTRSG